MEERTFAEELREGRRTGTYKFIPDENSAKSINDIVEKLKRQAKEDNKKDKRTVNVYLGYDSCEKEWRLLSTKEKIWSGWYKVNFYENKVEAKYYKDNITKQLKDLGFSRVSVKIKKLNLYTYLKTFKRQSFSSLLAQKLFNKRPVYRGKKDTALKIKFSW